MAVALVGKGLRAGEEDVLTQVSQTLERVISIFTTSAVVKAWVAYLQVHWVRETANPDI